LRTLVLKYKDLISLFLINRRSDPNDSLKNTVPKASHNFISDVFDLFDLDFEEYIKKGEMSYELLIDPAMAQLKQKNLFKRGNAYEESRLKEVQSEDEAMDEINAGKDDQTISKKGDLAEASDWCQTSHA